MPRTTRLLQLAWDQWRAIAGGAPAIAARRDRRLAEILTTAREVPLYQQHWKGIPEDAPLSELPPMTKYEWVDGFDGSVTDPRIKRDGAWRYSSDVARLGRPWLGRYSVCRSSGVSGRKSLFVNDENAMDVYAMLWLCRGWLAWLGAAGAARFARRGARTISLVATNEHHASVVMIRHRNPFGRIAEARSATFSILKSPHRIARALERWQPSAIVGYSTILDRLATFQREGRISLDLALAVSVSEWVEPEARGRIQDAFGCPLRDSYAASEFLALGFECGDGWLHLNDDWVILEAVDRNLRPVPPGETSDTALVTNLANHLQPVVRHDVMDRVERRPDPCPCGSPLTAIRLEGRRNEVLVFEGENGRAVPIQPLTLVTLVCDVPGVEQGCQFVQTAVDRLSVRIAFSEGVDDTATWSRVERRIRGHLRAYGGGNVVVERSPDPPSRDLRTGKFQNTIRLLSASPP